MDEKDILQQEAEKLERKMNKLVDPLIEKLAKLDPESAEYKAAMTNELKPVYEKFSKLQEQYDALDLKLQKMNVPDSSLPVHEQLLKAIERSNMVADWKAKKNALLDFKGIDIMQLKTAGNVTRGTDTIAPQFTPVQYVPGRRIHVRDLLPVGTTTSSTIWMPYESATTNGIARTAEGSQKGQSDMTFATIKWPIEKIATFIVFTEEILEDMPQFMSYITNRWIELLKQAEDNKLLYGTGSSDIKGLTVAAASYVDVLADAAIDRWMVLDAAATQVQAANFTPNIILMHPTTCMHLRQERTTTHEFTLAPFGIPPINGCTVIPHAGMTVGDFLVGDFNMGAMLWDRVSANIRFYDQDGNNAQYNLITAVIEERLALVTYQSSAFVFGDFTSALAKGSA